MVDSVFLAAQEISVGEADGQVLVTFKRAGDFSAPVTITYGITADTATNGADYTAPAFGTVTIPIGADQVSITIPITNDALSEATEAFVVSIVGVNPEFLTNGIISAPRTARVSILDDENPVTPPVDPPLVSNFNVTLQTISTGHELPIKLEFLPGAANQALVGQKDGLIKVIDTTTGAQVGTFLDLRSQVNAVQDRGLIDIAVSPNLAQNPYFYATFAVDPAGTTGTGLNGVDGSGNRFVHLVRYTLDAATNYTTIVPGSAVTLVGNAGQTFADISGGGQQDFTDPANAALVSSEKYIAAGQTPSTVVDGFKQNYWKIDSLSHIGGAIAFGPDGMLYVSTGDGTSFDYADPRTPDVLNVNSLAGKVLRLDPVTGQGLTDNPFYTAGMSLDSNAAKVYQSGLRNPFAMGFSADGQLFISNTGWNSYEMIESGPAGANFGWPYFEGGDGGVLFQTPIYKDFASAPAFYAAVASGQINVTPAYRAFAHDSALPGYQVQAITAGDVVYSGDKYPIQLANDFFFADVVDGELYSVDAYNRQDVQFLFKGANVGITDFNQGPDGYVYYIDLNQGIVGRLLITPKATGNLPAMTASGSAAAVPGAPGEYVLTNAVEQLGGLMSNARIDLTQNFVITFAMNFGANDFGADGVGFVLHNDPRGAATIGWGGANHGLMSIVNGIGIAFDTYQNADRGDIVNDSASWVDTDALTQTALVDLGNIEDGAYKTIVVSWNAISKTLSYTLNGATIGTITDANFIQTYLGGSNFAYFGFTGATGGAFNTQSVRIDSVAAVFEGAGANSPPVAVNDVAAAIINTPLVIAPATLLANDTDADNNPLTLTAVSNPTNGVVTLAGGQITFTPNAGFTGAASFQYTVSDGVANATGLVTVNVQPPSALPALTISGSAANPAVDQYNLTNALDQLGSAMSAVRLDVRQNFTIGFELNFGANDFGADGIGFVLHNDPRGAATQGWGGANLGLMSIVNGLGIAFDTYQNADRGDIVNDSASFADTDGLTQTARIDLGNLEDGLAKNIVVSWNAATQTLSYTLNGAAIGSVTDAAFAATYFGGSNYVYFGFSAATGGAFNAQSVKLTSLTGTLEGGGGPTNTPPVAVDDAYTATLNTSFVIAAATLAANDTDANLDPLSVTAVANPLNGTVVLAAGQITFTPTAGYTGAASFDYTVADGNGGFDTGTVNLTIQAASNTPPTAVADTNAGDAVGDERVLTFGDLDGATGNALLNDVDPDAGDTKTVVGVAAGTFTGPLSGGVGISNVGTYGFLRIEKNGVWQYNILPDDPELNALADGAQAQDVFSYTMQDASGASSTTTITVTVTGADDLPIFALDGESSVAENTSAASVIYTANAVDPEGAAVTYALLATPDSALFNIDALTGALRFNAPPNFEAPADANGDNVYQLFIAAYDGPVANEGSLQFVAITVTDVVETGNAPPTAVADTNAGDPVVEAGAAGAGDPAAIGNVLTNDTDPNVGDTKTVVGVAAGTQAGPVAGGVGTSLVGVYGALTLGADGAWTYALANADPDTNALAQGAAASDIFSYTMQDAAGAASTTTLTINITGANDTPTVAGEILAATRNTPLTVTAAALLANDSDVDGNTLTLSAVSAPVNGTVSLAAGQVTFTPTTGFVGAASFAYTVSDGAGGTANATATVNVTAPASQAPVAVANAYSVNEDTTLGSSSTRNLLSNDTDPDTPLSGLTAELVTGSANGGTVTVTANGRFTYRGAANFSGIDTFTYRTFDGVNYSLPAIVTMTVNPINDAPVITYNNGSGLTLSVVENQQLILAQITVTDADGTAPVYSLTGADAGDFTIGANGTLRFTTPPNFEAPADSGVNNQYVVTVRATDTAGVADTINLTINVQDAPEGAVLLGTAGNDTNFRGTAGADIMQAGAGNDTVLGLGGNDVFLATVGDGADSYTGSTGVDTIDFSAITAAATINLATGAASSAQTGADTLATIENATGGAGADTITGTTAANRLSGGAGADVLTGGGGSDVFVFGPGFGADLITDFGDVSGNQDMVSFSGFLFTDISSVLSNATQAGADTVINLGGGDVLTLANYQLAGFGADDFFI